MNTDGYTPAIKLEQLLRLARRYGPTPLAAQALPSDEAGSPAVEQLLCPCVHGEACISEALADEFERLARVFRQQQRELQPQSCPQCETRWEDEGGRAVADPPGAESARMH